MLIDLKTIAVALFATISLTRAFATYEPHFERNFVDEDEVGFGAREYDDYGLSARSYIDATLDSLTTRELLEELYTRMKRQPRVKVPPSQAQRDAIQRCRTLLANAAGKTIQPNAVWPLEECLKKLFDEEGVMPVANWKVAPSRPPSPAPAAGAAGKGKAGRKK